MTAIFFDVETIGTTDEAVIADIAAAIKPPGNISKAETIAKWEAENRQKAIDDAVAKTSFDGGLGRIVCIAWAIDDGVIQVSSGDEVGILADFFLSIQEASQLHYRMGMAKNPPVFVGHNITGFDIRFVWQRSVCLGIKPPDCFPVERWQQQKMAYDTMTAWNPDKDKRISMKNLCRTLGVESSKDDMDGSQVWGFFKSGRIDEITSYCKADVSAIRQCYKKMNFQ